MEDYVYFIDEVSQVWPSLFHEELVICGFRDALMLLCDEEKHHSLISQKLYGLNSPLHLRFQVWSRVYHELHLLLDG